MSVPWGIRVLVHTLTLISGNLLAFLSTAGDDAVTAGAVSVVRTKDNSCGISTHVSIAKAVRSFLLQAQFSSSEAVQKMAEECNYSSKVI
jgi:hypothetical protein